MGKPNVTITIRRFTRPDADVVACTVSGRHLRPVRIAPRRGVPWWADLKVCDTPMGRAMTQMHYEMKRARERFDQRFNREFADIVRTLERRGR